MMSKRIVLSMSWLQTSMCFSCTFFILILPKPMMIHDVSETWACLNLLLSAWHATLPTPT